MNNQSALDIANIEGSATAAKRDSACEACGGKGWLLTNNLIGGALEIQRCDSCHAFITDEEARDWGQRVPSPSFLKPSARVKMYGV